MEQIYLIKSDFEDEYKLRISSDNSGIPSDEVYKKINENGILVFNIELERTKGANITSQKVLSKIESRLFSSMFERYANIHEIKGIRNHAEVFLGFVNS